MPLSLGARLTVDLGNTRCKLRLWDPSDAVVGRLDLEAKPGYLVAVKAWLEEAGQLDAIAMCAVAGLEREDQLRELLQHLAPAALLAEPDFALELDCAHTETIGRDRLFAARGAVERTGRSSIVVDCGTALTVDLVLVEDGRATFKGGAIAPGPELLAQALREGGARLPGFELDPAAPALGKHTRAALQAGVAVGLRGAARELVQGLAETVPGEALPLVLTGGARDFVTSGLPLAAEVIEVPDLVHVGLLAAIEIAGGTR